MACSLTSAPCLEMTVPVCHEQRYMTAILAVQAEYRCRVQATWQSIICSEQPQTHFLSTAYGEMMRGLLSVALVACAAVVVGQVS